MINATDPSSGSATAATDLGEPCRYLVIGYGNCLRRDDGAGYAVADQVAAWMCPPVRSLAVHQLTPDLAEAIAQVGVVIFVDVTATPETLTKIQVKPVLIGRTETFTGHYADPRSLLALSHILYQASPVAYQILIPAVDFNFGNEISAIAQAGINQALAKIKQLVGLSPD